MHAILGTVAFATSMLVSHIAFAGTIVLPTAFFISKSENKNEVHYSVTVDERCLPVGDAPVQAYWRDKEKGPNVTSPLLPREQPAYGIGLQRVTKREGMTGEISLTLRALPQRALRIVTGHTKDGVCHVWTHMTIASQPAQLFNIHAMISTFSIDSIILTGWADSDKRVVRETIKR